MKSFEFARPTSEEEAVECLAGTNGSAVVLAGGLDLTSLLRANLISPSRVVDLKRIFSLHEISRYDGGTQIGALVTLHQMARDPFLYAYRSLPNVIENIRAIQIQHSGTIGGDLCHLPNCWYFRSGHGLLALQNGVSLPEVDDNRYHAILGNQGPAKFVNASRFAPALIAWGARVRIVGPSNDPDLLNRHETELDSAWVPLEYFYVTPKTDRQTNTVLGPEQFISHIWLPGRERMRSATYEVMQSEGLDWPLASASVCLDMKGGMIRTAKLVLGHVAPIPWVADEAARLLIGQPMTEEVAELVADVAVSRATPLSMNGYKVQQARTAVKRALLKAVSQGNW